MSKARLVITAITVDKRSVAEVVAEYGVARSWLDQLLARYRVEGEATFEPRSRRSKTSPRATPAEMAELALRKQLTDQGLDAGGHARVAPATPPRHGAVAGDDPPNPQPARRGDTRPGHSAQIVVPAVRRRAAQQVAS